ncbi:MAG TPA: DUF1203 domain-containing protein [Gammaproteobacteria bacterium]|nr:DUF1203 domain-containing protein [Gammaproteobacteria bacterium]
MSFVLTGLEYGQFEPLFSLSDSQLAELGARRVIATHRPGFPCRVSLEDAAIGEELLLLPYVHHDVASPYRASGPIFIRRGVSRPALAPGQLPEYVTRRVISVRAYDSAHMMVDAAVCEGAAVGKEIERQFAGERVAYIHLHNAPQGCFSCQVNRA